MLARAAETLMQQYKLLVDRYNKNKETLCMGLFSDEVIETARGTLIKFFKGKDQMKYVDMIKEIKVDID